MCHVCTEKLRVFYAVFRCAARSSSCSKGVQFQHAELYTQHAELCVFVCLCVQTRTLLWGSTREGEGFLGTGPLTGKHFIGCLRILMTSAGIRLDFGPPPTTDTSSYKTNCMFGMQNMAPTTHITHRPENIAAKVCFLFFLMAAVTF